MDDLTNRALTILQEWVKSESLRKHCYAVADSMKYFAQQRGENPTTYTPPQTDVERVIAETWQRILHVDRVGTHDNFFDLGANSLLMVQAHSHLRACLNLDLSLVDLFRYPTVSTLAAHLSATADNETGLQQSQERANTRLDAMQRRMAARQVGREQTRE